MQRSYQQANMQKHTLRCGKPHKEIFPGDKS